MNKLASLFNIEPGEGRTVALLFLNSFLLGAANNFVQTAAFALFMVEFDAQGLALGYVVRALVVSALTFVYLRLGQRLSFSRLLLANLGCLLLLTVGFGLGLKLTGARWLVFALPVLFEVVVSFGNLEFWPLAGRIFNVRQGKRLFGLVGGGQWLAIVITGLLIPLLVNWLGTANLLLLAAVAVTGALGLLFYITRSFADNLTTPAADAPAQGDKPAAAPSLLKNRYVLLISALVVLWWVAFFFVDNLFYDRSAAQFPGEEELASFLGIFLAGLGIVTLFSNTFLSGSFISRFGVRVSLLFLPFILVLSAGATAITGTFTQVAVILFALVVLTKLLDMALGFSIDLSALVTLYQPLPPEQRDQAQAMAEGVFQPVASGLAGLVLIGLNVLFASSTLPLIYATFCIVAAWLVVAVLLGRQYPVMLMQALTKRRLGGADLTLTDGSSRAVLQRGLQSPHPGVVIYALNTLEAIEHESLPTFLQDALQHPAPQVRREALQRIERLGLKSALPGVEQRVVQEADAAVRGAAVRTLAALGESQAFTSVSAYLQDPDPLVRQGAMVGLLRSGGIEGVLTAGQQLLQMARSPAPAERALAAQVLGQVGIRSFYQSLVPLFRDEDVQVQRAALSAAGQIQNVNLWPLVLEKLSSPPLRQVAASALVAGGEATLPELSAAYAQEGQSREVLAQLVRICGRIGGERATDWLKGQLTHPDAHVRSQVLRALSRCGYQAQGEEAARVQAQIAAEVARAAEILAILVDIADKQHPADKRHPADRQHLEDKQHPGDDEAVQLLREALGETLVQVQARTFFLLSFLYDQQAILQTRDTLRASLASAEKKAYALEVLDVLVAPELKRMFFPLLTDAAPGQKLEQLQALFPQPQRDRQQRLQEIIASPPGRFDAWSRSCALYAAGRLSATALSESVLAALSAPEALVRETAVWALSALDGDQVRSQIQALYDDPHPQVVRAARQWETVVPEATLSGANRNREEMMLSTIEKVLILKRVGIFAETPDETLAEVALLLEEMPIDAGQTLFEKGDLGDCLYIIVDGEVRVHDGERTLNHLQAGDVFGEMAILDAEPRVASITAVTDTQLLRLDQEPFYELMDDRGEVARGIILVLSRHLRARVQDLNELRTRFEAAKVHNEPA